MALLVRGADDEILLLVLVLRADIVERGSRKSSLEGGRDVLAMINRYFFSTGDRRGFAERGMNAFREIWSVQDNRRTSAVVGVDTFGRERDPKGNLGFGGKPSRNSLV